MIELHAVYKRFPLDPKRHIDWGWKKEKSYSMQILTKRELVVATVMTTKKTLIQRLRHKNIHFIQIKGLINEEDIAIINIPAPNNRVSKSDTNIDRWIEK